MRMQTAIREGALGAYAGGIDLRIPLGCRFRVGQAFVVVARHDEQDPRIYHWD
jgi:hypothetical protein